MANGRKPLFSIDLSKIGLSFDEPKAVIEAENLATNISVLSGLLDPKPFQVQDVPAIQESTRQPVGEPQKQPTLGGFLLQQGINQFQQQPAGTIPGQEQQPFVEFLRGENLAPTISPTVADEIAGRKRIQQRREEQKPFSERVPEHVDAIFQQGFERIRNAFKESEDNILERTADVGLGVVSTALNTIMLPMHVVTPASQDIGKAVGEVTGNEGLGELIAEILPFTVLPNPIAFFAASKGSEFATNELMSIVNNTDLSDANKERVLEAIGLATFIATHRGINKAIKYLKTKKGRQELLKYVKEQELSVDKQVRESLNPKLQGEKQIDVRAEFTKKQIVAKDKPREKGKFVKKTTKEVKKPQEVKEPEIKIADTVPTSQIEIKSGKGVLKASKIGDKVRVDEIDGGGVKGTGIKLYEKLFEQEGSFVSDNSVSQSAKFAYEGLKRRGFEVKENSNTFKDGLYRTKDPTKPVFEVIKKEKKDGITRTQPKTKGKDKETGIKTETKTEAKKEEVKGGEKQSFTFKGKKNDFKQERTFVKESIDPLLAEFPEVPYKIPNKERVYFKLGRDIEFNIGGFKVKLENPAFDVLERIQKNTKSKFEKKSGLRAQPLLKAGGKIDIDAVNKAKVNIINKTLGRTNLGFDPTLIKDFATIGTFHFNKGVKKFGDWAKKMREELGKKINPFLLKIWAGIKKEFGKKIAQIVESPLFPIKQTKIIEGKFLTPEQAKIRLSGEKPKKENAGANLETLTISGSKHLTDLTRSGADKKTTFAQWSKKMVNEFGEGVKPQLLRVWGNVKKEPAQLEPKVRGFAKSTEKRAIESGLVKEIKDLPTYEPKRDKPRIEKVAEIIANDFERAKRIALGLETHPTVEAGFFHEGLRLVAEKNGDANLIIELANSKINAQATEAGQFIQALKDHNPLSTVKAVKDIIKERVSKVKDAVKRKVEKEVTASFKKATKKNNLKFKDWDSFIKSIRCI